MFAIQRPRALLITPPEGGAYMSCLIKLCCRKKMQKEEKKKREGGTSLSSSLPWLVTATRYDLTPSSVTKGAVPVLQESVGAKHSPVRACFAVSSPLPWAGGAGPPLTALPGKTVTHIREMVRSWQTYGATGWQGEVLREPAVARLLPVVKAGRGRTSGFLIVQSYSSDSTPSWKLFSQNQGSG